jgi:dipeptidyl aminopeptidase/acylaminoacyl peptidase
MTESDTGSGFRDFDSYLALPRVTELALSPDGIRLVATVAGLNEERNAFVSALWELDPTCSRPARRLTRSKAGESGPQVAATGTLLFVSKRDGEDDEPPPALWQLPPGAGEATRVLERPGGVSAVRAARQAPVAVVATPLLAGSADTGADEQRRTARKEAKVGAVLHEASPVRHWDHDLGPDEGHLQLLALGDNDPSGDNSGEDARELTPTPGRALDETSFAVSPDGATVVTSWNVPDEPGYPRASLVAIDTATGERRVLADEPYVFFTDPAISPDGRSVVCVQAQDSSYEQPPRYSLRLIDLASGEHRELVTDPDVWPAEPQFSADGAAVFFQADEHGHRLVFRHELASGQLARVTASGHYTNLLVSPDGAALYALRDHVDHPPAPVRLDAGATDGPAQPIPAPGGVEVPGHIERVDADAPDGTVIEGWLALPDGASASAPAPLLLWIHGGPLSSWNSWSWRWNPWLMVARGYAVLLPDPAFSTGYGADMVARGWGQWGGNPFTDLMAITDAVVARPDVDQTRTAAMGGSYGGYMANWAAGHTDRFRCIVTHASLWALDQFTGTTDTPAYWVREWGLPTERPERYAQWSPHHFVDAITTPMLVVHGDKDYRVPIGEGLRLWWDLQRRGVESRYLYFPDEGHWVLKPGNARVWYETVWAWLAQHVLDQPWHRPDLL